MYALKPASFFRPGSRPTSPAPVPRQETPVGPDRAARPLSKLSLSTFRKPSPSPVSLPAGAATPSTVVQDGSFMEVLSLKLSEAVSRALAQPAGPAAPGELLAGRRPIPSGRGRALGAIIISEINASRENPHVYRAVLRTLRRPLSVLSTNLSSNLVFLISSPAFSSPAAPTPQSPELNATQLHAASLATFAGELLESFDEIGLGFDVDTRGESIRSIREGLVSIVNRVVDPLLSGIKQELVPVLDALETVPPSSGGPTSPIKSSGGIKSPVSHPAIMTLQAIIPIHARALSRIVASVYAENALASLVISLIWRGMVALTHRPIMLPSPPASPAMGTIALKSKDSRKTLGGSVPASPPVTPPASRFTLKLPPSRPPSPPSAVSRGPTLAADGRTLYQVLNQLPKPSLCKSQTRLAREVVDEAYDGLSAFIALLESIQVHTPPSRSSPGPGSANTSPKVTPLASLEADLDMLTADIPIVIALPILLRSYFPSERSVPAILGLDEGEYRKNCLSGFGRAEECGVAVGQRVLDVLRTQGQGQAESPLFRWLERELKTAREEKEKDEEAAH